MDDLLRDFCLETDESLTTLRAVLAQLEEARGDSAMPDDVLRLLHRVKGASNFLGLERVAVLAEAAQCAAIKCCARDSGLTVGSSALIGDVLDRIGTVIAALTESGVEPQGDDSDIIDAFDAAGLGRAPASHDGRGDDRAVMAGEDHQSIGPRARAGSVVAKSQPRLVSVTVRPAHMDEFALPHGEGAAAAGDNDASSASERAGPDAMAGDIVTCGEAAATHGAASVRGGSTPDVDVVQAHPDEEPAEASALPMSRQHRSGPFGRGRLLGERQLIFLSNGRVRHLSVPSATQAALAVVAIVFIGWLAFASIYYVSFDWLLEAKGREVAEVRQAYSEAMDEVDDYHARFEEITRNLDDSKRTLLNMIEQSGVLSQTAGLAGEATSEEMGKVVEAHEALGKQLRVWQSDWATLTTRNKDLESAYSKIESKVQRILSSHEALMAERDKAREKVEDLTIELANLRATQEELVKRVSESTSVNIVGVEKLIKMTGLDPEQLLEQLQVADGETAELLPDGQGGPFIEVSALPLDARDPLIPKVAALDLKMGRWHNLQRIVRMLPLAAPVDHYRLTSGFGKRLDPMRKRWSSHSGVDLANLSKTPILNPAPGKVVFAGWFGGHGRLVEIDHGLGIHTRYGHLKKILVKRGQRVEFRDKIGLMGSSGRSTGTHLHFEVRVNGNPVNPLKFMKAGKYVFKGN